MNWVIEKELMDIQIKYIENEIEKIEGMIKNKYNDTLDMVICRSNYIVELKDAETLEERLDIYKIWYQQVLYILYEFQEEYKSIEFLRTGIDY